jgi:hypothetical protein
VSGPERFIFTVATGRCGQSSLTDLAANHVPGCYPAFEEPDITPVLPRLFDNYERRFRRRFIETHELLGRGKVLTAYEGGDHAYIEGIARRRLRMIRREMKRRGASIYFDVSKFFARGLHAGFTRTVERYALVNLVRDPIRNMRSFLNRGKSFTLDNNIPDARSNILRLDSSDMAPGEFYLWAWFELYLRFEEMRQSPRVTHAVEIRTEHLEDAARMNAAFDTLGLTHTPVRSLAPGNTNRQQGFAETLVTADDVALFVRFLDRVPATVHGRIPYLKTYEPHRSNDLKIAEAHASVRA